MGMKTPEERASALRALFSGTETPKTWKVKSGPPDVVTTAMFRAAARRTEGFSLSPLEERWLGIYTENKETARSIGDKSILAASVLQMDDNEPYTAKMLIKDALAATPKLLARPENAVVDISKFTDKGYSDSPEYAVAVAQSNASVTSFTGLPIPPVQLQSVEIPEGATEDSTEDSTEILATDDTSTRWYRISVDRFKCYEKVGDPVTSPKNEIYFSCGSGSDGKKKTDWTTGKFGSVDTGTVHHLNGVYLFEGPIQTSNFPSSFFIVGDREEQYIYMCEYRAFHLEMWEHDSSGNAFFAQMSNIMKDVAQECIDAAVEANNNQDSWDDSGSEGIALLALIGFIAHAFSFLFSLAINEDDHVQNRNFIFSKAALVNLTKPHLPNETSFIFEREGKVGRFEVWVKFYPLTGPTGTLQTATLYSESWWTPPQTVSGQSVGGSGMTLFKNNVTCVYRDRGTQHLMVTKLPPGSGKVWTLPARISVNEGGTAKPGPPGRPSLAVFKDKLFCAFRKLDGRIAIIHTEDNLSWKGQTNIGLESKGYSPSGPALGAYRAAYDGAIYCVIRGMDNRTYSLPSSTGTIWYNDFHMFSGSATQGAPAVCVFDNKLQIF
ncbi:hypothetical protein BOTCAL_0207g00120 [Botryotinia calthae]|uniref:Fucose-specific lectin n=1 Tax=Botryotinia calthae TaxID=38488 RepID=A0A4Y8D1G2_9HELO|nr:hypothetical protein BOTCAL_0207g00120 [Botryotinia calthae]